MTAVLEEWSPPGFSGTEFGLLPPRTSEKGAKMPASPTGENEAKKRKEAADVNKETKRPQPLWFKAAVPAVILGAIVVVAAALGGFSPLLRMAGLLSPSKEPAPLAIKAPTGHESSPDTTLRTEEATSVDPSKARLPLLEKPVLLEGKVAPESSSGTSESSPRGRERASPREPGLAPDAPKAGESPAIVARQPASATASQTESTAQPSSESTQQESASKEKDRSVTGPSSGTASVEESKGKDKKGKEPETALSPRIPPPLSPRKTTLEQEDHSRAEQFQLPGSLIIKIHNYAGVVPKWGLMVILDDSAHMARRAKTWNPSRLQVAKSLIGKLPNAVTPGSKIAVRDFLCEKSEKKPKPSASHCLSHVLYDWAESPFSDLAEKVGQSSSGGPNNPCAAAAFSLKKDFGNIGALTPRILLLTDGAAICNYMEILNAIDEQGGGDRIRVDVLALGIAKKRQKPYSTLTGRTNGFFFKIDKPSDADGAASRYEKILKTRTMETIEIRGDRVTHTTTPGQQVTLVPGSYSVVLPVVAGIHPSKRRIENVKISSGHRTEIEVKKGRPTVKILKEETRPQ